MSQIFGPFYVEVQQITNLKNYFTAFMNELLRCELATIGDEPRLVVTKSENTPDGGIDAFVDQSQGTKWIPRGDSVWQYKQNDCGPTACEKEITEATAAREKMIAGAEYRMVLGGDFNKQQIDDRLAKLVGTARTLGLLVHDDRDERIQILNAGHVANWASSFPSLAVNRLIRGHGNKGINFTTWSASRDHRIAWINDSDREQLIVDLRSHLIQSETVLLRVHGKSGQGKTRLVMEALRHPDFEPLVIYIHADELDSALFSSLTSRGRSAIVVADDATPKEEKKIASMIPSGGKVKVLVIRAVDDDPGQVDGIWVPEMGPDLIDQVLETPALIRGTAQAPSAGSPKNDIKYDLWATEHQVVDQSLLERPQKDYLSDYLKKELAGENEMLMASLLALFTRIGWDEQLAIELELLSKVFGIPSSTFREFEAKLGRLGLIEREGRYRKMTPQPVACHLAREAWRSRPDLILGDLIPALLDDLEARFYRRMAEIGSLEVITESIQALLSADGPFSTLATIESKDTSKLLVEMAIVAPDLLAPHLTTLIDGATSDQLRQMTQMRRNLVRTLTKLVWHSKWFETAANDLLALALAENEHYANNATGIWRDLFNPVVPATAANPAQRIAYLSTKVSVDNVDVLLLVTGAIRAALDRGGGVMVDGEEQGGVTVEPRGMPATYGELFEYQNSALGLLAKLLMNENGRVSSAALDVVVGAIHSLLEVPLLRATLVGIVKSSASINIDRAVNLELRRLEELFSDVELPHGRLEGIQDLKAQLPSLSAQDDFLVLMNAHSWDFAESVLRSDILTALQKFDTASLPPLLHQVFDIENLPAALEIGSALAEAGFDLLSDSDLLDKVISQNINTLRAFLMYQVEHGQISAFDDFLEGNSGRKLSQENQYFIMMVAPDTASGLSRVNRLARTLPPGIAATYGVAWISKLPEQLLEANLADWTSRLSDQASYNAVVEYGSFALHNKTDCSTDMQATLLGLLQMRADFPEVGRQDWAWARVAKVLVENHSEELAVLLIELISIDSISAFKGDEDLKILQHCAVKNPEVVFSHLSKKLEEHDWRISMAVRDWLSSSIPIDVFATWVAGDLERARILSSICEVGTTAPTTLVEFLLINFNGDEEMASNLYGTFWSGGWVGKNSDRLQAKIDQLDTWLAIPGIHQAVKDWIVRAVGNLMRERDGEIGREAEEEH